MHINMNLCQMVSKSKDSIYCVQSWLLYVDFFSKILIIPFRLTSLWVELFSDFNTWWRKALSYTSFFFNSFIFTAPSMCLWTYEAIDRFIKYGWSVKFMDFCWFGVTFMRLGHSISIITIDRYKTSVLHGWPLVGVSPACVLGHQSSSH